jgi:hypothetical protein
LRFKLVDPFTYERTAKKASKVVQTIDRRNCEGPSVADTLNTKGTDKAIESTSPGSSKMESTHRSSIKREPRP